MNNIEDKADEALRTEMEISGADAGKTRALKQIYAALDNGAAFIIELGDRGVETAQESN